MTRVRPRKVVGLALAAFTLLVVMAGPSTAAPHIITVGGSTCGTNQDMVCTGVAQGVLIGISDETIAFSCAAVVAKANAASTGVECWLRETIGGANVASTFTGERWMSGPASVAAKVMNVPVKSYRLCIRAGYLLKNGTFRDLGGGHCTTGIPL